MILLLIFLTLSRGLKMKIIKGNIWDYRSKGFIIVPTNGFITKRGEAVMGRGLALQTKQKYPEFPLLLGWHLSTIGNVPGYFHKQAIITLPVKYYWKSPADLNLITRSAQLLGRAIKPKTLEERSAYGINRPVYMPKVGCLNGRLNWESQVYPIIEKYLPNRTVVDLR